MAAMYAPCALLIDDHAMFRVGLRQVIKAAIPDLDIFEAAPWAVKQADCSPVDCHPDLRCAVQPHVSLEDLDTRAFATEDQLGFLARYAGDAALPVNLVYGGNDAMLRNGVPVQSWQDLNGLFGHAWGCT